MEIVFISSLLLLPILSKSLIKSGYHLLAHLILIGYLEYKKMTPVQASSLNGLQSSKKGGMQRYNFQGINAGLPNPEK